MRVATLVFAWIAATVVMPLRADCGGDLQDWLGGVRSEALALGIGETAVGLMTGVRLDEKVLARDRSQQVFGQDWQTFAGRMVNGYRLKAGTAQLARLAGDFAGAERMFGVPGSVVAALGA